MSLFVPDVGVAFEKAGHKYMVKGWLKEATKPSDDDLLDSILYESAALIDGIRLAFCSRKEATHVSGSGVCGCVAKVSEIRILKGDKLPDERRQELLASARKKIGRLLGC